MMRLKSLKIALKNKTKKKFSSHLARELLFYFFLNWNYLRERLLPLSANDVVISTAPNAPNPKLLTSPVSGNVDWFAWLLCELLADWLALELLFYFWTRLVCTTELPKIKLATRTAPTFFPFWWFLNGITFLCLFGMFVCHLLNLLLTFAMTLLNTRKLRQGLNKR